MAWLREMAQKNRFLTDYIFPSCNSVSGEPEDYIYKLDYKSTDNCDIGEYLNIFADVGWEYAAQIIGWHYFRLRTGRTRCRISTRTISPRLISTKGYSK
ncbi:MAG: DUF2812 domain-containing protein [bacterium]